MNEGWVDVWMNGRLDGLHKLVDIFKENIFLTHLPISRGCHCSVAYGTVVDCQRCWPNTNPTLDEGLWCAGNV